MRTDSPDPLNLKSGYSTVKDGAVYTITDAVAVQALRDRDAEIERLQAALALIESVTIHSGGDIHGVSPKAWENAFIEVQAMARAALGEKV